jgi:D-alanyl-D-alanine carboxypeptidase (penicillin-binding protein 5/6)
VAAGSAAPIQAQPEADAHYVALTARAAYVVDLTAGIELYSDNADEPLAPASTTKVVTAVLASSVLRLDQSVTIVPGDLVDPMVFSNIGLQEGDVVSVRDLLAGVLVASGGEAANALARAGGAALDPTSADPTQRFIDEMNRFAKLNRMRNSSFTNPSGMDDAGHRMSARDLAIATEQLFRNPNLERLVSKSSATITIRGPNARTTDLLNTNELLGTPGVHGVKTGTTDDAGECLVLAAWRGDDRIVTIVLGSTNRYADTRTLLDDLDQRFKWVRLGRGGDLDALNTELAARGLSVPIVTTALLTTDEATALRYAVDVQPGAGQSSSGWNAVGSVQFSVNGESILRLPLYAGDPTRNRSP